MSAIHLSPRAVVLAGVIAGLVAFASRDGVAAGILAVGLVAGAVIARSRERTTVRLVGVCVLLAVTALGTASALMVHRHPARPVTPLVIDEGASPDASPPP